MSAATLGAFTKAVDALFSSERPPEPAAAAELARVHAEVRALPPAAGPLQRDRHHIAPQLARALAVWSDDGAGLRAALAAAADWLPWRYSYAERGDAPGLGERIAFAELVGPVAPIRSDRICVGVTLIAPRTIYPDHRHPAIELYRVLSGTAAWGASGVTRRVPPGGWVLHPSGATHSMRTDEEPLLALYTWSGDDVTSPSVYV